MAVSNKGFVSIYTGAPQLDQLNDDMRAAELLKEAPRLAVPESQFRGFCGDSWREGGKRYRFVDDRKPFSALAAEATLSACSLGTFRMENGGLAYFAVLFPPARRSA
jgi:hypothetical protein